MEALRIYLNTLSTDEKAAFCKRCDTSLNYLRKAISAHQSLSEGLAIQIERASSGKVRCEQIRPDVDWAYIRGTRKSKQTAA